MSSFVLLERIRVITGNESVKSRSRVEVELKLNSWSS